MDGWSFEMKVVGRKAQGKEANKERVTVDIFRLESITKLVTGQLLTDPCRTHLRRLKH
jgi:hypothetical protein